MKESNIQHAIPPDCEQNSSADVPIATIVTSLKIRLEPPDWKCGSAQESVSPCDFGGFCSLGKLVRRRSRCCGNVGTRVLCGFPSSEGNARTLQSGSRFSALGASFPQQALDFVAFRTGCICEPVIRLKCTPFRKLRRMRTSSDSCTEPEMLTRKMGVSQATK